MQPVEGQTLFSIVITPKQLLSLDPLALGSPLAMDSSSETVEAVAAPVSPREEEQSPETEQEASKAVAASLSSESRLPQIWSHYLQQLQKIDELERKLDERATRSRRRVQNILDQSSSHRNSHLRMFITHQFQNALSHQALWTLVIEGKPLVGLLDHESAARVDAEGCLSTFKKKTTDNSTTPTKSYMPTAAKATAAAGGTGAAQVGGATTANTTTTSGSMGVSDRYRYIGGEAEDYSLDPTFFTHFFHKIEVVFRTIYQPRVAPPPTPTPTKKSRNKRKADRQQQEVNSASTSSVSQRDLRASEPTQVIWNQSNSADADAFFVQYSDHYSDRPMPPGMKFHSIVAVITLYPIRSGTMYKPSKKLAETLFPRHQENPSRQAALHAAKKRKMEGGDQAVPPPTSIPLENDIQVPALLTMKEITTAIYMYIEGKGLQDSGDKSIINLDKTLQSLFERETMNFAELRQTLFAKNLITEVGKDDEPVILTYVMKKESVSQQQPAEMTTTASQSAAEKKANTPAAAMVAPHGSKPAPDMVITPTVFSFDMDIAIPSLFHCRARELLHKIKKREFEYTSSRTRARYLLVARRGSEEIVKTKIEQAVAGQGFAGENTPIFLALAKAAPPKSEARVSAQIDAQTCAIVERLEECNRQAEAAWDLVDACKGLGANS